jgi:hypothetical protein
VIQVKKLNEKTIDVFSGIGWNNWSRFDVAFEKGRLSLKLVKGKPMTKEDFRTLYQELS